MRDHWKAVTAASFIMLFLFSMSLFLTTVSAKASERVKELVDTDAPLVKVTKKPQLPKHKPSTVTMDTSIKNVSW